MSSHKGKALKKFYEVHKHGRASPTHMELSSKEYKRESKSKFNKSVKPSSTFSKDKWTYTKG
jgi:hypothetical protein